MFMYALGRRLALDNDAELKFDVSWWNQSNRNKPRNPSITNFDVVGKIATPADIKNVLRPGSLFSRVKDPIDPREFGLEYLTDLPNTGNETLENYFQKSSSPETGSISSESDQNEGTYTSTESVDSRLNNSIADKIERVGMRTLNQFPGLIGRTFHYYRELKGRSKTYPPKWAYSKTFSPKLLDIDGDAYLEGYWQTPYYFESYAETIREDFSIPEPLSGIDAEVADQISATNSVSIHIRRGDPIAYSDTSETELWGNTAQEYVENAIEYVEEQVDDPHFFVFSDDLDWMKDHLELSPPTSYVTHNDGMTDYMDMELMRRCDHNVISGSTFSWWGAWLNENDDKIVLAPDPWKTDSKKGLVKQWDLIPEDWTIIEYK